MKTSLKAARQISKVADPSHINDLYKLMESDNFYVREVIADPLARLEGVRALPILFQALQRGEQQGHDNDGLTNTMIGLFESNKDVVAPMLIDMTQSPLASLRADAAWALGFVASAIDPEILFKLFTEDPDAEVRGVAADSLQIYLFTSPPDSIKKDDLKSFDGKWMWTECEPHLMYGFEISGDAGICIKANATTYNVGDVMLKIKLLSSNAFVGEQIFTNGVWYPVTAYLDNHAIQLYGAGLTWSMEQITDTAKV
jgi:hypothetical protein